MPNKRAYFLFSLDIALFSQILAPMILSYSTVTRATPFQQFLLGVVLLIIGMISLRFFSTNTETPWLWACASLGFYSWINAVLGFFRRQNWLRYVGFSMCFFVLLSVIAYYSAIFTTKTSLSEVPYYLTTFVATIVFYSLLTAIVSLIRTVCGLIGLDVFAD